MDDKQAKDIAAALWALKDELEKVRLALEKVTGWDESMTGKRFSFIRTLDIGREG